MGKEIDPYSIEARKERVLMALRILGEDGLPALTEDEESIVSEYRELAEWGYGRLECQVVGSKIEYINLTKHKKRKDLINLPRTS